MKNCKASVFMSESDAIGTGQTHTEQNTQLMVVQVYLLLGKRNKFSLNMCCCHVFAASYETKLQFSFFSQLIFVKNLCGEMI